MNEKLVVRGFSDLASNKPSAINDATANMIMNKLITNLQAEKVQPAIEEGKIFLAANKKKPGVKTTKSGLQYEVLKTGTGIRPTAVDTFVVHYRGTLLDGTEFDASYNRNQPLKYGLTQVVKGWTEGLQLMNVGSKYKFYVPYNLAYGVFDNPPIPGGSLLIFEIELLDVKRKK
jgi:FKBP-type peptidyl-prolyl cis-trans isomerase FklB